MPDSKDILQSIVDSVADPMMLIGNDRVIQFMNKAARDLYLGDRPLSEQVRCFEVSHGASEPCAGDRHPCPLTAVARSGGAEAVTHEHVGADGSVRVMEIVATPLKSDDGSIQGIVECARDVTERHRREREYEAIAVMTAAMRTAATRDRLIEVFLTQIVEILNLAGAALAIVQPDTDELLFEQATGIWSSWKDLRLSADEGVTGQVMRQGSPYVNNAVFTHPETRSCRVFGDADAVACVPLITQNVTIGALWAGTRGTFDDALMHLMASLGDIAANAIHRMTLLCQANKQLRRLNALREIDKAINASLDIRVTLGVFLDQVIGNLGLAAADVLLVDTHTRVLSHACNRGFRTPAIRQTLLRPGQGLAGRAASERRLIVVPNLARSNAPPGGTHLFTIEGFVSYFAVPLISKGLVGGVLEVYTREEFHPDTDWLDFLQALALQAAIAVDNAWLFDNLQRSNSEILLAYDETLEGWSRAMDMRDRATEGHSARVSEMAVHLSRALGVAEADQIHIRRGSLLHDIGKMAIPDEILLKPAALAPHEWEIMRQHPVFAYKMLSSISFLRPALNIPLHHHEEWDGSGYPMGLSGREIPLAARIFSVVDVWDALCSERPYRGAWSKERAREHLFSQAGRRFDPEVVAAFLEEVV